jgi:hypothetical protein
MRHRNNVILHIHAGPTVCDSIGGNGPSEPCPARSDDSHNLPLRHPLTKHLGGPVYGVHVRHQRIAELRMYSRESLLNLDPNAIDQLRS